MPMRRFRSSVTILNTFNNKFLQSTGSQMPHRCCPLANKVENIDRGKVRACARDPRSADSRVEIQTPT